MTALIKEKVQQAREVLNEYNIDCWLTFTRESQLNGDPSLPFLVDMDLTWHSALIITSSGKAIAIVGAYDKKTVEDLGAYDDVIGYVQGIKDHFLATFRALNPSSIAINYSESSEVCDGLTYGMYLTLQSYFSELGFLDRLVSAEKIVSVLRQRRTPSEIQATREAVKATEELFKKVRAYIRPGMTEKEIAAFMKKETQAAGLQLAWEPKICPAVFTGPDNAEAHYMPTDQKVEPGHILNVDFGVKINGYCADLQRSFYIRRKDEERVPDDVGRGFNTVLHALESSRRALKPGVFGHEIDRIARTIVSSAGYDEFPHGLGHQVGRFAHDGTALLGPPWEKYADKPFQPIEKGMVFTLEPRLTVPGRGIATIEEMVLVNEDGADYLSTPQQELWLIP
jgi:Xaa-Pro aminopeptidase